MAFRKDPIEVGLLLEAVGSGLPYEVVDVGTERDNWLVRAVGDKGRRMERTTDELNDPFKWTRINLDELTPEQREQTIQGKPAAEPPPPAEDAPAGADDDGPPAEREIPTSFIRPGLELLDDGEWVTVKQNKGESHGWIELATSAGDRRLSFFARATVRGVPTS